jgi:hypothetical protein
MIELPVVLIYIPTWQRFSFQEQAPQMPRVFAIILVLRIVMTKPITSKLTVDAKVTRFPLCAIV